MAERQLALVLTEEWASLLQAQLNCWALMLAQQLWASALLWGQALRPAVRARMPHCSLTMFIYTW